MQSQPLSLVCEAFLDMDADLSHPEMEKDWWESLEGSEDLLLQEMEMQPSPSVRARPFRSRRSVG